jgi:hypothetical protein
MTNELSMLLAGCFLASTAVGLRSGMVRHAARGWRPDVPGRPENWTRRIVMLLGLLLAIRGTGVFNSPRIEFGPIAIVGLVAVAAGYAAGRLLVRMVPVRVP